jgi:predicted PurR-regulated permease PerM
VFGVNGFVIGPVIAAVFLAAWDIFADVRHEQGASAKERPSRRT